MRSFLVAIALISSFALSDNTENETHDNSQVEESANQIEETESIRELKEKVQMMKDQLREWEEES